MGLWSLVDATLASGVMALSASPVIYSSQRVGASSVGSSSLGPSMGGGGSFVLCHSDNTAVVSQVNSLHSQDPVASNMLRCLAYFQAHFDFRLRAVHIQGVSNIGADDLSRNRAAAFLGRFSQASSFPSQVDQELFLLLCQEPADWTSVRWRERFASFWRRAWTSQPSRSTRQAGSGTLPLPDPSQSLPHP